MTAVTALNKVRQFVPSSQMLRDITIRTFFRIPWPSTLYCVTRGDFSSTKQRGMEHIRVTFVWTLLWLTKTYFSTVLNTVCCKQATSIDRKDRVPPDALPKPQGMPLHEFFKIQIQINPVSRIAAVDELVVSKAPENSQISLYSTPLLSGSFNRWAGTRDTKPLDNIRHVYFLPHRDEWDKVLCCTGKGIFIITDSSQEW
jgi:hypothetical protein